MKIILALVALVVVVYVASFSIGAHSSAAGTNTMDIAQISENPGEWSGQEVKVTGFVGFCSDNQFVLIDDSVTSTIIVKSTGLMPKSEMLNRVIVMGFVDVQIISGEEQAYIFADSWEYI